MYSLNVPVPSTIGRLASDLADDLPDARARTRGNHTLVVKRFGERSLPRLRARVRELLRGQDPFDVRVTGVEYFAEAERGPAPVVYLAVESPALQRLHEHLLDAFDPVAGMEGEAYVPHVTIARGGRSEQAVRLADRSIEPVSWTVTEVAFRDGQRDQQVGTVSLPP